MRKANFRPPPMGASRGGLRVHFFLVSLTLFWALFPVPCVTDRQVLHVEKHDNLIVFDMHNAT